MRFVNVSRVPKNELGRVFKSIEKMLTENSRLAAEASSVSRPAASQAVAVLNESTAYNPAGATSAADLMIRFCNHLNLAPAVQAVCVAFANRVTERGTVAGRSPISIAAAGIYFVSAMLGIPKSPREIGEIAGVSESTIKNAYKYLYRERHELVDPKWLEDGKGRMENIPSL